MSALSPEEQKVFDALVAKQNQPVVTKAFNDVGDVLRYLVRSHPGFTTNPDERQEALDILDQAFPAQNAAPANEGN